MKIGKYEKVTARSAKRLETLRAVRLVCDAVMINGGAASIRKERAARLIRRIDTVLMEHRIAPPVYAFREVVDRGDLDCRFVMLENYGNGRGQFMEICVCADLSIKPVSVYPMSALELVTGAAL